MIGIGIALVVVSVNVLAFAHARALLVFSRGGEKTKNPESLSPLEKIRVLLTGVVVPKPADERTPDALGLPFTRVSIPVVRDIRLGAWHIPREGATRSVLLFHGFTASKAQLLPEAAAFHARGYAVLLVDFRGSGDSSESYTSVGYDEADDVIAAVRYAALELGMTSPLLYGRSMGAAAVLRACALGLDGICAVILEGVFDRMLSTVKQRFMSMGLPATPLAELLTFWGGVQHGFWAFAHNPIDYAPRCRVPALMLHGSEDVRATLQQARGVFDALGGEKKLAVFEGAGHEELIAFDRAKWDAELDAFARQTKSPAP